MLVQLFCRWESKAYFFTSLLIFKTLGSSQSVTYSRKRTCVHKVGKAQRLSCQSTPHILQSTANTRQARRVSTAGRAPPPAQQRTPVWLPALLAAGSSAHRQAPGLPPATSAAPPTRREELYTKIPFIRDQGQRAKC